MSIYTITLKRELLSGGHADCGQANWVRGQGSEGANRGPEDIVSDSKQFYGYNRSEKEKCLESLPQSFEQPINVSVGANQAGAKFGSADSPARVGAGANEFELWEADGLECSCGLSSKLKEAEREEEGAGAGAGGEAEAEVGAGEEEAGDGEGGGKNRKRTDSKYCLESSLLAAPPPPLQRLAMDGGPRWRPNSLLWAD